MQNHASAMSLLKGGEQRCIKVINDCHHRQQAGMGQRRQVCCLLYLEGKKHPKIYAGR